MKIFPKYLDYHPIAFLMFLALAMFALEGMEQVMPREVGVILIVVGLAIYFQIEIRRENEKQQQFEMIKANSRREAEAYVLSAEGINFLLNTLKANEIIEAFRRATETGGSEGDAAEKPLSK